MDLFEKMFGAAGNERHPEAWAEWLQRGENDFHGLAAISALVRMGCEERYLVAYGMEVQRSTFLRPISKTEARTAKREIDRAAKAISRLADSFLAYESELAVPSTQSPQRGLRLANELFAVSLSLSAAIPFATARENAAFVRCTVALMRYVRWKLGHSAPKEVSALMSAILRESFDAKDWRKRHRADFQRAVRRSREVEERAAAERAAIRDEEREREDEE